MTDMTKKPRYDFVDFADELQESFDGILKRKIIISPALSFHLSGGSEQSDVVNKHSEIRKSGDIDLWVTTMQQGLKEIIEKGGRAYSTIMPKLWLASPDKKTKLHFMDEDYACKKHDPICIYSLINSGWSIPPELLEQFADNPEQLFLQRFNQEGKVPSSMIGGAYVNEISRLHIPEDKKNQRVEKIINLVHVKNIAEMQAGIAPKKNYESMNDIFKGFEKG
jgi:hypothetical protein